MRTWFEWIDAAGWVGDMAVVGTFAAIAIWLMRLERR